MDRLDWKSICQPIIDCYYYCNSFDWAIECPARLVMNTIKFDFQKFLKLKKAYQTAKDNGLDTFSFNGNNFVLDYAKYMIQYLETKFK